jgi:hypothetical protein
MTSDNWFDFTGDLEDLTEEQQYALAEAYQKFFMNFMEYVHEVNPDLFRQAKQYAADYSGNDIIKFFDKGDKK